MTACERCDGQGEVFDRKDYWGNDLTVQCPECHGNPFRTAYEVCRKCGGSGLQDGMNGPVACWECRGDCMTRIRDERGRFMTVPVA